LTAVIVIKKLGRLSVQYNQINAKWKLQRKNELKGRLKELTSQLEHRLVTARNYKKSDDWQYFGFEMYKAGQIGHQIETIKEKLGIKK